LPLSEAPPTGAHLAALLARWPAGVDVVPASRLDRHTFTTLRATAIALDSAPDWRLLRSRYPDAHAVTLLEGNRERATTLAAAEGDLAGARFLVLAPLEPFIAVVIEPALVGLAGQLGWSKGDLNSAIRMAITGRKVGPPLYESLEVLGQEKSLKRIEKAQLLLAGGPD